MPNFSDTGTASSAVRAADDDACLGTDASANDPVAGLGTGDVAQLLGIHPSTVKRWFDRAGPMDKTAGGHRRIPLDIALRVAHERGRRVYLHGFGGHAAGVWDATEALGRGDPRPACDLLVDWLRIRRSHLIGRFLWHVAGRGTSPDPGILDAVFGGFMRRVGEEWQRGSLRIADERAASREVAETTWRLLSAVEHHAGEADPDDLGRGSAIVGTVESERHVLGSQLVRLLLVHRGWHVEHLGTGVPVPEIMTMQRRLHASLVCVSFTPPATAADVHRFVDAVGDVADPLRPFSLVLGGGAASGVRVDPRRGTLSRLAVLDDLAALDGWLDEHFPRVIPRRKPRSAPARV